MTASRTLRRSALPRHPYLDALVPARGSGAWLVVGSSREIELIPVTAG